jgi:hypothetical protein
MNISQSATGPNTKALARANMASLMPSSITLEAEARQITKVINLSYRNAAQRTIRAPPSIEIIWPVM